MEVSDWLAGALATARQALTDIQVGRLRFQPGAGRLVSDECLPFRGRAEELRTAS